MLAELIITLLLILSLSNTSTAGLSVRRNDNEAAQSAKKEEREARALAVEVVLRLKETGESGSLDPEFFLDNFAERFQQFIKSEPDFNSEPDLRGLMDAIELQVILDASPADLRRAYFTLINFWIQCDLMLEHMNTLDSDRGRRSTLREMLPPDFFTIAASDPLLNLINEALENETASADSEEDEIISGERLKAARIRTIGRLRSFTDKVEKGVELMREGVKKLKSEAASKGQPASVRVAPEERRSYHDEHVYRLESEILEEGFFGLPPGTRLIHVRLFPYAFVMVRSEGRLKLLGVLPDFDGD
ncbi:MAG: hypothetical protein ACR2G4_14625 [Pyrinomonadaceae bacterium]